MLYGKTKRVEDKSLLETIKEEPCLVCSKTPSDPHHMTTRGAGGGDTEDNVVPLCRKHHVEYHQVGLSKFAWKYPKLKEWLNRYKRFDILGKI